MSIAHHRRAGWRGAALICAALALAAWLSSTAPSQHASGNGVAVVGGRAVYPPTRPVAAVAAPSAAASVAMDIPAALPADLSRLEGRSDRTAPPTTADEGIRARGEEYIPDDGSLRP